MAGVAHGQETTEAVIADEEKPQTLQRSDTLYETPEFLCLIQPLRVKPVLVSLQLDTLPIIAASRLKESFLVGVGFGQPSCQ